MKEIDKFIKMLVIVILSLIAILLLLTLCDKFLSYIPEEKPHTEFLTMPSK